MGTTYADDDIFIPNMQANKYQIREKMAACNARWRINKLWR
jgi:hypothetical protein